MKHDESDIRLISIAELPRLSAIHRWELLRHPADAPVESAVSVAFDPGDETVPNRVALRLGVRYMSMRGPVMRPLLNYFIRLEFEIADLDHRALLTDTSVYLATGLLPLMLNIGVGALRGMLALRVAGTSLARHPLPILSMARLLESITAVEKTTPHA